MKFNKIVMIGLAAFTLSLSACKEDPGLPVEKVTITKVEQPFIVGEVIDLDAYVNVEGGKGQKVYTATAAKGYESRVEFGTKKNAHKVTILEEGAIRINIVAENLETKKTGVFSANAYTKLKAAFVSRVGSLDYNYSFASLANERGEEEKIDAYLYHNENYYYGFYEKSAGNWKIEEGIIRYENSGNTYEFTTDGDFACTGFEVGERLADIDRYSTNQQWFLTAEDVKTATDANGETYLTVSSETPATDDCPYSIDFYKNLVGEMAFKFFNSSVEYKYQSETGKYVKTGYSAYSLDIYAEEDAEGNVKDIIFNVMAKKGSSDPVVWGSYKLLAADKTTVPFLEAEVKSGEHEPEPIPFDEIGTVLDAIAAAGNYTSTYKQWWSSDSAGKNVVDLSEDTAEKKNIVYSWLENCYEVNQQVDGEGRRAKNYTLDGSALLYEKGWAKKGADYITFGNDWDEETESYLPVSSEPSDANTFNALENRYSLTRLTSDSEAFVVDASAYQEVEGLKVWAFNNSKGKMNDFLSSFVLTSLGAGYTAHRFYTTAFESTNAYSFLSGYVILYADGTIEVDAGFSWTTDAYYNVEITISDIGSTVLDLTGIPDPVVL